MSMCWVAGTPLGQSGSTRIKVTPAGFRAVKNSPHIEHCNSCTPFCIVITHACVLIYLYKIICNKWNYIREYKCHTADGISLSLQI